VVSDQAKGLGVGNGLMARAMAFVDQFDNSQTRLWTFRGLDAARHLYEKFGFQLVEEQSGSQWGTQVAEQKFIRSAATPD